MSSTPDSPWDNEAFHLKKKKREKEEIIWNSDDFKPSSVHKLRCRYHYHSINSMLLSPGIWSWQTWHHFILKQHVKKPHSNRRCTLSKPKLHISHTRILETNNFCKSVPNPFAKTIFRKDDFSQRRFFADTELLTNVHVHVSTCMMLQNLSTAISIEKCMYSKTCLKRPPV